jgi:hypothetical protein
MGSDQTGIVSIPICHRKNVYTVNHSYLDFDELQVLIFFWHNPSSNFFINMSFFLYIYA